MNPPEEKPLLPVENDRPGLPPRVWITGLIILVAIVMWVFASGPVKV